MFRFITLCFVLLAAAPVRGQECPFAGEDFSSQQKSDRYFRVPSDSQAGECFVGVYLDLGQRFELIGQEKGQAVLFVVKGPQMIYMDSTSDASCQISTYIVIPLADVERADKSRVARCEKEAEEARRLQEEERQREMKRIETRNIILRVRERANRAEVNGNLH